MAFRPSDQVLDPLVVWIPQSFTMANIRQACSGMQYMESLWQSVRISLVSSLLSVAVYSLVGYGFALFSFRLKKLCFAILIFTIILPPQALLIPQYLENSYFDFFFIGRLVGLFTGTPLTVNILDSVWALSLIHIWGRFEKKRISRPVAGRRLPRAGDARGGLYALYAVYLRFLRTQHPLRQRLRGRDDGGRGRTGPDGRGGRSPLHGRPGVCAGGEMCIRDRCGGKFSRA